MAAAVAEAKLKHASADQVMRAAENIIATPSRSARMPDGEFWKLAFHQKTLDALCRLRASLTSGAQSDARVILRAIVLGALHGPMNRNIRSYFSNQCPRTFSPKPTYAVKFWRARAMKPPKVDVLDVIRRRAVRYLAELPPKAGGTIVLGDSRDLSAFGKQRCFDWVITSPPYYGMRTYVPDQWLRHWFLGGPEHVDYSCNNQLQHSSAQTFALELRKVWCNAAAVCTAGARLIIRFGGINDRNHDPLSLLRLSFRDTPWRCQTVRPAGTAEDGRRQCRQFGVGTEKPPRTEYDIYAALD